LRSEIIYAIAVADDEFKKSNPDEFRMQRNVPLALLVLQALARTVAVNRYEPHATFGRSDVARSSWQIR